MLYGTASLPCMRVCINSILFQKILGSIDTILYAFRYGSAGFLSFLLGSVYCGSSVFLHAFYGGTGLFLNVAGYVAGYAFSLFESGRYGFESTGHTYLVGIRLDLVEICASFGELTAGHEVLHVSDTLLNIFSGSGGFDIIEK